MVKVKDFSIEDIQAICDALNNGHEVHIKKERNKDTHKDNVCIVEEYRKLRKKVPCEE